MVSGDPYNTFWNFCNVEDWTLKRIGFFAVSEGWRFGASCWDDILEVVNLINFILHGRIRIALGFINNVVRKRLLQVSQEG